MSQNMKTLLPNMKFYNFSRKVWQVTAYLELFWGLQGGPEILLRGRGPPSPLPPLEPLLCSCCLLRLLNPHILLPFSNLHWLKVHEHIEYKLLLLSTKFLQPVNLAISTIWSLFNFFAVPTPHLLSPFVASSSLKITDHSFRYASPHLWNQLPDSFRQSCLDSPPHSLVSSSLSSSPLSSPVTLSLQAQILPT